MTTRPSLAPLEAAALRAVVYADLFDYSPNAAEIHRYLHGVAGTPQDTARALRQASAPGGVLRCRNGCYTLPGREGLVEVRRRRTAHAERLWPSAVWWGRRMAGLPFVRTVAVTGALAWNNVEPDGDIDYLIVARPGRVWLCRAFVAALGRVARLAGVQLCANYVVSARALVLPERDLYTAYELAHMTPIAGFATYRRMRRLNRWSDAYLPNALGPPALSAVAARPQARSASTRLLTRLARLAERALGSSLGAALERGEMARRIRRRAGRGRVPGEAVYAPDYYKDHLGGHRHQALLAFTDRLAALGVESPPRSAAHH